MDGAIRFRLHVSALGTVSAVDTIQSDPIPIELRDGLRANLIQALLEPARKDGKPISSTLDITVRFERLEILRPWDSVR